MIDPYSNPPPPSKLTCHLSHSFDFIAFDLFQVACKQTVFKNCAR